MKTKLPPQAIAELGTCSDKQLALKYGVSPLTIRNQRTKRHIPAHTKINLSTSQIHLIRALGTAPDNQIARQYNLNTHQILHLRKKHNIPPYKKPPKPAKTPRTKPPYIQNGIPIQKLLGTAPDAEIARIYKISKQMVSYLRKQHNIPPHKQTRKPSLQLEQTILAQLPHATNNQIAREHNLTPMQVRYIRKKHNIPPYKKTLPTHNGIPLLEAIGTAPDTQIAKNYNIAPSAITVLRIKHNLPHYKRQHKPRPSKKHIVDGTPLLQLLGTMSDTQLAIKSGLTQGGIYYLRQKHNIPQYQPPKKQYIVNNINIKQLLGKMSDPKLAKIYNLSPSTILKMRRKHNIPPYQKPNQ